MPSNMMDTQGVVAIQSVRELTRQPAAIGYNMHLV